MVLVTIPGSFNLATWTGILATAGYTGTIQQGGPIAPGAPTGLSLTPGNQQIAATWTAPANNGGSAITVYKIYNNGTTLLFTTPNATPSFTITGLTNGTLYNISVAAVNAIGIGNKSYSVSATPAIPPMGMFARFQAVEPEPVPNTPTGVTAVRTGDYTITVSWNAPAETDPSVNSYYIISNDAVVRTLNAPATTTNLSLSRGSYHIAVIAINEAGQSPQSILRTVT